MKVCWKLTLGIANTNFVDHFTRIFSIDKRIHLIQESGRPRQSNFLLAHYVGIQNPNPTDGAAVCASTKNLIEFQSQSVVWL